jgi:hypothetical protein
VPGAIVARGMGAPRQISLRLLAPLALAAFSVVFLVIVVASLGGGESSPTSTTQPARTGEREQRTVEDRAPTERRAYVVKPGDTFGKIAVTTGVPVEDLQALNPSVDPHALVTGQRIKLRE